MSLGNVTLQSLTKLKASYHIKPFVFMAISFLEDDEEVVI